MGHDLVTSDGTTLLGADDKAGVAEIMAAVAYLARHPELAHGALRVAFTPDEEIGQGTKHFSLERFGAAVAYTVDGSTARRDRGRDLLRLQRHRHHPGPQRPPRLRQGQDGQQPQAGRGPASAASRQDGLAPETTSGREGYVHPNSIEGAVEETVLRFIVRDFDGALLEAHEALLQRLADEVAATEPRARITVEVARSYRNMKEYLDPHPRALDSGRDRRAPGRPDAPSGVTSGVARTGRG